MDEMDDLLCKYSNMIPSPDIGHVPTGYAEMKPDKQSSLTKKNNASSWYKHEQQLYPLRSCEQIFHDALPNRVPADLVLTTPVFIPCHLSLSCRLYVCLIVDSSDLLLVGLQVLVSSKRNSTANNNECVKTNSQTSTSSRCGRGGGRGCDLGFWCRVIGLCIVLVFLLTL